MSETIVYIVTEVSDEGKAIVAAFASFEAAKACVLGQFKEFEEEVGPPDAETYPELYIYEYRLLSKPEEDNGFVKSSNYFDESDFEE